MQFFRLRGEQNAVGGERQIFDALYRDQLAHQRRKILADQRLASGDADFADAQIHGDADEALDFLEAEDLRARLKTHLGFGHAIKTADIAADR